MATNNNVFEQCKAIAESLEGIVAGNVLTDGYGSAEYYESDGYIWHAEHPRTAICSADSLEALGYYEKSIGDWLNEQLEVSVTSTLDGVYRGATILCTYGGPTIEVNTLTNSIDGRWGMESASMCLDYDVSRELDELIESIWSAR